MSSNTEFLIKDIRPGSKNINVVFIVLEISKWLTNHHLLKCASFQSLMLVVNEGRLSQVQLHVNRLILPPIGRIENRLLIFF